MKNEIAKKYFNDWTNRCWKNEISRRLSKLAEAPFVKVEAND